MPQTSDETLHQALESIRDAFAAALNHQEIESLLTLFDERAVFTALNTETAYGRDEIRAYHDRLLVDADHPVESMRLKRVSVDRRTADFSRECCVAAGSAVLEFDFNDGLGFETAVAWTATFVKRDGQFKIAALHTSANAFENPLLAITRKLGDLKAVGAAAAGLGLGALVTWFAMGRRGA